MDHNLEDSLNLESAIGEVDFEHSQDTVVDQGGITLDASSEEGLPMEFEHIEEQPMLMDTGNESEIIDFMGEQFTLQEYSVHDDQMTGATTTMEANQQNTFTSENMVDMKFETPTIAVSASSVSAEVLTSQETQMPKIITVKGGIMAERAIAKKEAVVLTRTIIPRQVAIAPKPPKLLQASVQKLNPAQFAGKQYAIAPKPLKTGVKPVALVANRQTISLVKKVSLSETQETTKETTVLAQIGKQLVMVPASGGQKIKLVTASSGVPSVRFLGATDGDQAQLVGPGTVSGSQSQKQMMTKLFVQGSSNVDLSNQPAVITKIMPAGSTAPTQTRYVTMHQKTVPISIGNSKVLMGSPTKTGVKFSKKQLITIKSPSPKITPTSMAQGTATKKVVITANPTQNVILRTTAPSKTGQVIKPVGQRTQLHQINVPGKGIQYIKLVTNPPSAPKQNTTTQATTPAAKTFLFTDSRGNLIQMSSDKVLQTSQPPPLLVTGSVSSASKVLTSKSQQKLVRIAPITSKSGQAAMQGRGGQSLLAPLSPAPPSEAATELDVNSLLESEPLPEHNTHKYEEAEQEVLERTEHEETDSKAALQALIADAVGSDVDTDGYDHDDSGNKDIDISFPPRQSPQADDSNSMERPDSQGANHPLIVIPSSYMKQDMLGSSNHSTYDEPKRSGIVNVEVDPYDTYQPSPNASQEGANEIELGLRPRKACNCTKSQCLKLYCDCFANGEFCNRCNCNNCHNNLENEELRQKAIRGCLDRNPNAFRPKIGKSKAGGPEITRRHNKGCNCKRSGCLKNYCECYEAKIACTSICKCVGCRNVEETLERARRRPPPPARHAQHAPPRSAPAKQPCSFMTTEVIEAVCQCLLAAGVEGAGVAADGSGAAGGAGASGGGELAADPVRDVLDEFARCLQDIISASHQAAPLTLLDEAQA